MNIKKPIAKKVSVAFSDAALKYNNIELFND
jgi:hypothetical protein